MELLVFVGIGIGPCLSQITDSQFEASPSTVNPASFHSQPSDLNIPWNHSGGRSLSVVQSQCGGGKICEWWIATNPSSRLHLWDGKFSVKRLFLVLLPAMVSLSSFIHCSITVYGQLLPILLFAVSTEDQSEMDTKRISRRTTNGFNLIPSFISDDIGDEGAGGFSVSHCSDHRRDRRVCYTLPIDGASKLFLKSAPEIVLYTCCPFIYFRFNFLFRECEQFQAHRT